MTAIELLGGLKPSKRLYELSLAQRDNILLNYNYTQEDDMGKKKANGYNNAKLQDEGIGIMPAAPSKNLFVRFWD